LEKPIARSSGTFGDALRIDFETDADGCTLVRPSGPLNAVTYGHLRDTLLKCATELPAAVIVDVDTLAVPSPVSLTVFSAAWIRMSQWPGVPILLVAAEPKNRELLAEIWVDRFVPVHPDLLSAKLSLAHAPPRRREILPLPWDGASPRRASRFVAQTCASWGIDHETGADAATVATELVENTVVHTHSPPLLRLELRHRVLTVAVSDADPAPAVIGERWQANGLNLVEYFTRAWGCAPTSDGGKVVWAVLREPKLS
jgi:anti-anti-sigma regulatory factor